MVTALLFFVYFLPHLASTYIGVDTYHYINDPSTVGNWLLIGRFGGVLIHNFIFGMKYSMFYAQSMAFFTYLLALMLFCFLFENIAGIKSWRTCFFFLLAMIHPIWIEQFYFTMQIFEIAVGLLLTAVSLLLVYHDKTYCKVIAVPVLILLFSIYQTFIAIYIAGCSLCFLLWYIHETQHGLKSGKKSYFKSGLEQASIFIVAFLGDSLISKAFFVPENHLNSQILWGKDSASSCIQRVVTHAQQIFSGEGLYYNLAFSVSFLVVLIFCLAFFRQYHPAEKWVCLLGILVLQATPLLLTVYMGSIPAYRSQFILPFATACNFLLAFQLFPEKSTKGNLPIIWSGIAVCVLLTQYHTASRIQYTSDVVRQDDERRAFAIEETIFREVGRTSKPVAFVGLMSARTTGSYVFSESTCVSMFQMDKITAQPYYDVTVWGTAYMRSLGINIKTASPEQIQAARDYAKTMPCWPLGGCVKDIGDCVVVKLAPDDYYANDMMEADAAASHPGEIAFSNSELAGWVDSVSILEDDICISGWIFRYGVSTVTSQPDVYLWDEEKDVLYKAASGTQYRLDLNSAFADGTDYSHAGVFAKIPQSRMPEHFRNFRIVLSVTEADRTLYFDTGKLVSDYIP